ncbi:hypothetical protein TRIUR3_27472 [Triticum urartu]|uniref:Protein SDA1 n=1 Tax=Triticum urartu TaxID=4572 RepID=M7ZP17_TRIUA|nr:hypothetical protein TRIUR3_27472 [Triticum urartu]
MELFMELQVIGDRAVKKLAFSHIVHSIRRMNQKHKNEAKNRKLQGILFKLVQGEEESRAKRAFTILCDLHRRRVWFDDRTANAICDACFHPSSRLMTAAISLLIGYENVEQEDDSDASSEDEASQNPNIILSKEDVYKANHKGTSARSGLMTAQQMLYAMLVSILLRGAFLLMTAAISLLIGYENVEQEDDSDASSEDEASQNPNIILSKEDVYKANHKGTSASKKKKKAKLERVVRSMKRQQRKSNEETGSNYYSPLTYLKDPQGFAEKLFSRLQKCNERFEVRMMMLKVIARTIGLHHLVLLNFYPYLQRYVQVPPDAVEPLFKQIVNQFVHDRSRPEMMNEDLLQDLVLYKKSHEKAVSIAARSLITLFREICPSLLVKKDRGRPIDPTARPKAFGETTIASDVPGAELLDEEMSPEGGSDDESDAFDSDDEEVLPSASGTRQSLESLSNKLDASEDHEDEVSGEQDDAEELDEDDSDDDMDELDDDSDVDGDTDASDEDEDEELNEDSENEDSDQEVEDSDEGDKSKGSGSKVQKRKLSDYIGQLDAADASLRALKKLAGAKKAEASTDEAGRIFGDEDFKRIKELKAKKAAKLALVQHGLSKGDTRSVTFKLPSTDELSLKRVDPSELAAHVKRKMTKEERLEMVKAGREDRGKYQARAAIKQKKTGGSSNKQKQHQKKMPLAAKRAKAARSRQEKKTKAKHSGKQFRGRKAWK